MVDLIPRSKLETGELETPFGDKYVGFKITVTDKGGIPANKLNYDDIYDMISSHPDDIYTYEEHFPDGKFKSISGSTKEIRK